MSNSAAQRPAIPHPAGVLWVFGYGSLMWHPGFPYSETRKARIHGYHRALCVWSWRYRGTRESPGLVLGLDRGGSCTGRVFRVRQRERGAVFAYLHERELRNGTYEPLLLPARLDDGRRLRVLAFVARHESPQYAGRPDPERAFAVVSRARGQRGANTEYVLNTATHLHEAGCPCARLDALARRLRALAPG